MNSSSDNPLLSYFFRNGDAGIHKWVDYFEVYHRLLAGFRGRPIKFLEIGVQNGGSIKMWREYFGPEAKIIGVDIDPACKNIEAENIEIWIGDQSDPGFWEDFCETHPNLDVVIDDGGHSMHQQLTTFNSLFPCLNNFGLYLCEDTHTSYFPSHGGGMGRTDTFHERIKQLIDGMHAWYHAPLAELDQEYWAKNLYSISFFDSVVALEKRFKNIPITLARGNYGHVQNPPVMSFLDMRRAFGVKD